MEKSKLIPSEYIKYLFLAVLIGIGFLSTEIYSFYINKKADEAHANQLLVQQSTKLDLQNIWNKLRLTKNLSFQDKVSFGYIGCNYKTEYLGKISNQNEYAKSTSDIVSEESLNFCPRSVESMLKYYNGEIYWIDGLKYSRKTDDLSFEITDNHLEVTDQYTFATRPISYLDSVLKKVEDLDVTIDTSLPDIVKGRARGEKGDNTYTFIIDQNTQQISSLQYELNPNDTMPRRGKIVFNYQNSEIIAPTDLNNIFSTDKATQVLNKKSSLITIESNDFNIIISPRENSIATTYKPGNTIKNSDCPFNQSNCQNEIKSIKQILIEQMPSLASAKKAICPVMKRGQDGSTKNLLQINIQAEKPQLNGSPDYSVDINFDFDSLRYQIQQNAKESICFEGTYDKLEVNKLYNELKTEAAIFVDMIRSEK